MSAEPTCPSATSAPLRAPQPTAPAQRIAMLDVVRGVALLGIFIMNMPSFSNSFYGLAPTPDVSGDALNRVAETVREMLFSGKFNSMFSLLFGLGFTLQMDRLEARSPAGASAAASAEANTLYARRLFLLLLLGLLHGTLFWGGDVLHIYALLGFGLLLVRRLSDRVIVGIILATLLSPVLSQLLRYQLLTPDVLAKLSADVRGLQASNNQAFGHGSFVDSARETTRGFAFGYGNLMGLWTSAGFYVQSMTTMLMGYLIGRHGLLQRIAPLMPTVKRIQWWALAIGLAGTLVFGIGIHWTRTMEPSLLKMGVGICYVQSRLAMMIFYGLTLVRLMQDATWQRRLSPFAAAGRMPLTNYLMQTAMGLFIFHSWGLGYWGKLGPAAELLLAPALFFAVQVPFSVWWFRRFSYGPLEYVWRVLTYGRAPEPAVGGRP